MDYHKVIPFNQNGGIPMSDGITISGIPVVDNTHHFSARQGGRSVDQSVNYFVYAPNIIIQNSIPDLNSSDVQRETPNTRKPENLQRPPNRHPIDDVCYSDDDRRRQVRRDAGRDFYRKPTRDDLERYNPQDEDFYRYPIRHDQPRYYPRYADVGCIHGPARDFQSREIHHFNCGCIYEQGTWYRSFHRNGFDGPTARRPYRDRNPHFEFVPYTPDDHPPRDVRRDTPVCRKPNSYREGEEGCNQQDDRKGDCDEFTERCHLPPQQRPNGRYVLEPSIESYGGSPGRNISEPTHMPGNNKKYDPGLRDEHTTPTKHRGPMRKGKPGRCTNPPIYNQNHHGHVPIYETDPRRGQKPVYPPENDQDHRDQVPIDDSDPQAGEESIYPPENDRGHEDQVPVGESDPEEPGYPLENDQNHEDQVPVGESDPEEPGYPPENDQNHDDPEPIDAPDSQSEKPPEDWNADDDNIPVDDPDHESADPSEIPEKHYDPTDSPNDEPHEEASDETDDALGDTPDTEVTKQRNPTFLSKLFGDTFSSTSGKKKNTRTEVEEPFEDDVDQKRQEALAKQQEEEQRSRKAKEEKRRIKDEQKEKEALEKQAQDSKAKAPKKPNKVVIAMDKKKEEMKQKLKEATKKAKDKLKETRDKLLNKLPKMPKIRNPFKKKKK